jgi:hypothetical protein
MGEGAQGYSNRVDTGVDDEFDAAGGDDEVNPAGGRPRERRVYWICHCLHEFIYD